jgi:light-harvesting complex I chlorophyll a/b binding protein 1
MMRAPTTKEALTSALALYGASSLAGRLFVSTGLEGSPSQHPALRGVSAAGLRGTPDALFVQDQAAQGSASQSSLVLGALGVCTAAVAVKRVGPVKSRRRAFNPAAQEGVTESLDFFDPLGFSKGKDADGFRKLRMAEIKHGRVAMMASLGMLIPHFWKAPGFEEVPAGLGAALTPMGGGGLAALFLGAGLHELVLWKDDPSKDAGDFGDPFKFGDSINVERDYELNNGRMAMFAVLGQIVAELATGKDAAQQLGF